MTVTFETPAVEIVTAVRSQVGESPLWSVAEQALWWVDIEGRLLHRLDPASGADHELAGRRAHRLHRPASRRRLRRGAGDRHLPARPAGRRRARRRAARERRPSAGRHALQRRPLSTAAGASGSATMVRDMSLGAAVGALYRFDGRGLSAPLVPRPRHRQRPGLQPRRPHAVPVRLAPERAEDLGLRSRRPTARSRIAACSST